jgi:hypothetical protein
MTVLDRRRRCRRSPFADEVHNGDGVCIRCGDAPLAIGLGRGTFLAGLLSEERRSVVSELLIVFTLGYIVGGVSALALIAFTLAARTRSADRPKPTRNI